MAGRPTKVSIPYRTSLEKSRVPARVPAGSEKDRILKIVVALQRAPQNCPGSARVPAGSDRASTS